MLIPFEISSGLSIDGKVSILYGTDIPGDTSETDYAPQGSIYLKTDGTLYGKITVGIGTDKWVDKGVIDIVSDPLAYYILAKS